MPLLKPAKGIQLNRTHPLARGLVGCWLYNEGTGNKTFDLSGNGNIGTLQGDVTWVAGKYGPALALKGTGDYVDCGTKKTLNMSGKNFTLIAQVKYDKQISFDGIIDRRTGASQFSYLLSLYSANRWRARLWNEFNSGTTFAGPSITAGQWYQLAFTYDHYNVILYQDGQLYSKTPYSQTINKSATNSHIAEYNDGTPYYFNGLIDHIMIFDRAFNASEIALLYREPFCMFEQGAGPEFIYAPTDEVLLAGSISAQSTSSAMLKLLSKIYGTVTINSDVTALLKSIRCSPELERDWLKEALFNGMTSNAFKLGITLSLGWFWVRIKGCSALYRGLGIEQTDFENILTVAEQNICAISPPSCLPHNSNTTYFYIIRRFNNCGYQEQTLDTAVKVSINASSELQKPQPNKVFCSRIEQVGGNKIQLVWFYCPIEQKSQLVCFNVYYDGRTGQVDYEIPLATISYQGRRFYSYQSDTLEAGKYLFAIRSEDASGIENSSLRQLRIQIDTESPEVINILSAGAV